MSDTNTSNDYHPTWWTQKTAIGAIVGTLCSR